MEVDGGGGWRPARESRERLGQEDGKRFFFGHASTPGRNESPPSLVDNTRLSPSLVDSYPTVILHQLIIYFFI